MPWPPKFLARAPAPIREDLMVPLAEGQGVKITVRSLARARNITLRFDDRQRCFSLTVPEGYPLSDAESFLAKKRDWMQACLTRAPDQSLCHGAELLFHGAAKHLVFTGSRARTVEVVGDTLRVGGPQDLAPARLKRFLMAEAKAQLTPKVEHYASAVSGGLTGVKFGDMRSRWGSCSSAGTVKLSWRLIMAPERVQDYVAAHEACHLIEMNHSDRFWGLVAGFIPDWRQDRRWLRTEGARLQSVPFPHGS